MSVGDAIILLLSGLAAGVINSVSSGGSFFTYPALLLTGIPAINAAATTLVGLTPGNLFAIPEYWPEFKANKAKYPQLIAIVVVGGALGTALLLWTGADAFDALVPWLILGATLLFASSPRIADWAQHSSPSLTQGATGVVLLFVTAIYLTFFGSGSGNIFLALLLIRGFGNFFSANVAKNIVMSLGGVIAVVVYTVAGLIAWLPLIPIAVGSAIGASVGSRWARRLPIAYLRTFVIAFGLFVALWQFAT